MSPAVTLRFGKWENLQAGSKAHLRNLSNASDKLFELRLRETGCLLTIPCCKAARSIVPEKVSISGIGRLSSTMALARDLSLPWTRHEKIEPQYMVSE